MCENYVMHNITDKILNGLIDLNGSNVKETNICHWSVLDNDEKVKMVYEYFKEKNIEDEILLQSILLKVKENKFNKNICVTYDENIKKIINIPIFKENELSVKNFILSNKIQKL